MEFKDKSWYTAPTPGFIPEYSDKTSRISRKTRKRQGVSVAFQTAEQNLPIDTLAGWSI
jgi:hypothetical protein